MAVFRCRECGEEVSDSVTELQNEKLLDEIFSSYRTIYAYEDGEAAPQGFYISYSDRFSFSETSGRNHYILNLEDGKVEPAEDVSRIGCCGVDWPEAGEKNAECVNGHKVGVEVYDCHSKD